MQPTVSVHIIGPACVHTCSSHMLNMSYSYRDGVYISTSSSRIAPIAIAVRTTHPCMQVWLIRNASNLRSVTAYSYPDKKIIEKTLNMNFHERLEVDVLFSPSLEKSLPCIKWVGSGQNCSRKVSCTNGPRLMVECVACKKVFSIISFYFVSNSGAKSLTQ